MSSDECDRCKIQLRKRCRCEPAEVAEGCAYLESGAGGPITPGEALAVRTAVDG